ncbi:hypothetical protein GCM10018987_09500 [Streptomyces cremeus]
MTARVSTRAAGPATDRTVVGENLSLPLFRTLSGVLAGHPYLKVVVDRVENTWHLLDTAVHPFHVDYVATRVLGMDMAALDAGLDAFNASVYTDPGRRFLLGVLSLHTDEDVAGRERIFLVLETTEADTMHGELLTFFYEFVRERVDGRLPLLLKPANHRQEEELSAISEQRVPRVLSHELFGNRTRTPLNPGEAVGRLRFFRSHEEYAKSAAGLGWADIVAMPCLPDDVPRVAGFLNTAPTTPLSHTNVLASGWGIPNAIVRDLAQLVDAEGLDGAWVRYRVREDDILLERLDEEPALRAPAWHQQRIRLEPPLLDDTPVLDLHRLRAADRDRYGTKAANLGELHHVLDSRTADLTAYYGRPRPPRADLLGHLAARLGLSSPTRAELASRAAEFAASTVAAPEGVALPFALQQHFLASSPALQQGIGKLKMALELDAGDVLDPLCLQLQHLIRQTPVPESIARRIGQAFPGAHRGGTARGALLLQRRGPAGLLGRGRVRLRHHRPLPGGTPGRDTSGVGVAGLAARCAPAPPGRDLAGRHVHGCDRPAVRARRARRGPGDLRSDAPGGLPQRLPQLLPRLPGAGGRRHRPAAAVPVQHGGGRRPHRSPGIVGRGAAGRDACAARRAVPDGPSAPVALQRIGSRGR